MRPSKTLACAAATLAAACAFTAIAAGRTGAARAAPAAAPARSVTLTGTGDDGMHYAAKVKRRSSTRWCIDLTVRRTGDEGGVTATRTWDGEGYCGTIARESAQKIAFACPYGIGAAGIVRGRPGRIEYLPDNGTATKLRTRALADRSGRGTAWAASVSADRLPGRVVAQDGGRRRTVAELETLEDICA